MAMRDMIQSQSQLPGAPSNTNTHMSRQVSETSSNRRNTQRDVSPSTGLAQDVNRQTSQDISNRRSTLRASGNTS